MKLIKYENFTLDISYEALLVGPIRKLYNQDRTKGKEIFFKQMSILYFVYDPRSNYSYITNDADRLLEVLAQEGIDFKEYKKKYETDDCKKAIETYKKLNQTTSLLLLQDTRLCIDKVREFLRTIDLNATDDKGKLLNPINQVTSTIKQIPQLAKDLADAEKALSKEIEEQSKARGNSEMSLFDATFASFNDSFSAA